MLTDSYRRRIEYLRLSVTDRCNLRCVYCLPAGYSPGANPTEPLSDDEIISLAESFGRLGISKIRVTGGEPLVREGIVDLIGRLSRVPGIEEVFLTTNGILLAPFAKDLAAAGLRRINISLDTLDAAKFKEITRFGRLEQVEAGIEAALAAGLDPLKLNVVAARGMNDDEIGRFADLTQDRAIHVRFIELMPMGDTGFFSKEKWIPLDEIRRAAGELEPLPKDDWPRGVGPARYYRRPGARGTVGFISALSCGFCDSCNRMRLSARGRLFPCLDSTFGVDLREAIGRPDAIEDSIRRAVAGKPRGHTMTDRIANPGANTRLMCQVGG